MKNLKVFFTLTLMVMFVMTSCSKEENVVFQNVIDESELIPSSELYDAAEIEEWIKNLQNTDEVVDRAACSMVGPLTVAPLAPGSCDFQLTTGVTGASGETIIIGHYAPLVGFFDHFNVVNTITTANDCVPNPITVLIDNTAASFPSGLIYTYIAIRDVSGRIISRSRVAWTNC